MGCCCCRPSLLLALSFAVTPWAQTSNNADALASFATPTPSIDRRDLSIDAAIDSPLYGFAWDPRASVILLLVVLVLLFFFFANS